MWTSVKTFFSSGSSYRDFDWTDYRRYTTAISNTGGAIYSYLPEAKIPGFVHSSWNAVYSSIPEISNPFAKSNSSITEILWNNKERIGGGVALAIAGVAAAYFLTRKIAQKPEIAWQTSLGRGVLKISVPKTDASPPNVNISFCIDTSGSMQGEREQSVKDGVKRVIDHAQGVMKAEGARISMGAIGFDSAASTISDPTSITKESDGGLKSRISSYRSDGSTSIIAGINASIEQLRAMTKANAAGKNVLILLSDGQDSSTQQVVKQLRQQLQSINAEIFTIGIGSRHDGATLKAISGEANYIDTTKGISIEDAIAKVYGRAIATFSEMQIQLHGVPGTKWSLGQTRSGADSKVDLGALTEEEGATRRVIKIDSRNLDADLDLRRVVLELTYRDPKGIPGRVRLPWNSDSIIRPEVLKA